MPSLAPTQKHADTAKNERGTQRSGKRNSKPLAPQKAQSPKVIQNLGAMQTAEPFSFMSVESDVLSRTESSILDRKPEGAATSALPPRILPGGSDTRPLDMARVIRRFTSASENISQSTAPTSMAAAPPVPRSVSSALGTWGNALLGAATETKQHDTSSPVAKTSASVPQATRLLGQESGVPIPLDIRAPFEQSYGYDLSPIRLHQSHAARQSLKALNTVAFALNDHIVMDSSVDLRSRAGQHVLGHELAHTVQGRLGSGMPSAGNVRISQPSWYSEHEAEFAVSAALRGRRYEIRRGVDQDIHQIAPWLILAGIGLAAGLVTWAASDSPEENRARHASGEPDPSRSLWTLVPIYGSIQQIREAETYFQRVLGVGFLMLDMATLGSAGVAARALIRAPAALVRTAVQRQGSRLVVREGGEIATEAVLRETGEAFVREGGAVFATRTAATAEMMQALQRGAMILVTEGGINHAVMYARNAAGQLIKIHGGPLKLLFEVVPREITERAVAGMGQRANAYVVIEAAEAAVDIERATSLVQNSAPAIVRWLGGNPTSCGIMQGALLEASGLSAEALALLMPAGAAANRLVPITILDHVAQSGAGLRLVEGGMANIIGGTVVQESMLAAGGVMPTIVSTLMRVMLTPDGDSSGAGSRTASPAPGAGSPVTGGEPQVITVEPVPQSQIDTTVGVYVDVLSDADRQGYRRVVFTLRRTASEISPGFEKLDRASPMTEQGESMRSILRILVGQAARDEMGEHQIVATRSAGGWSVAYQ
ncbi:DUF4157 domain-containing protein [Enterovibrio sp. ZSDZ42]|uniref:DUF4157 domain-containing protein n=1 Tax=Enterovibrio gelatinilyticus TaxID=2899819 RepID=A0ABT5R0I5_9GAMM|nr:DUF4157 domain-containing protein [Enterovibrio sp. ZSDZ42]MDD1793360.1 DUF4157 domain-containing protein [Enterovibrio sp. ZSDZ42]